MGFINFCLQNNVFNWKNRILNGTLARPVLSSLILAMV